MQLGKCSFVTAALVGAASATIGATVNSQGVTELFGNSFGRPGRNATYDYVIVGGGNAGNTIAARLALDPANYSVAVIEAGSFYEILNGNLTQVPGYSLESAEPNIAAKGLASLTAIGLQTLPQKGYNGRQILYTVGQTFGGGSAANTGGYFRPTKGTFAGWVQLLGDTFWSWESVYPFYKKSCTFSPPDYSRIDPSLNISYDPSAFEPNGGPLNVSFGNYQGPYGPYLKSALARMGFKAVPGLSSGELIGYGDSTIAVDPRTATRSSSETSFLQQAARLSSTLTIYPNALAKKILFDANKKATGVRVQGNIFNNNLEYDISAKKEVIVSGGVWFSPQLLMVSGIGPSETLKKYNIDVVSDLPGVGQGERVNVTTNTQWVAGNPAAVQDVLTQYLDHQAGPLSGIGSGQGLAFEKFPAHVRNAFSKETITWLNTFPSDWPEAEYLPLETTIFPSDLGPDDYYLSIGSSLLATSSIGNMTISSNDTADRPVISPNWLLEKTDQEMAVAAFKRIREIAFNTTMVESEYSPGQKVTTNIEILNWLQNNMNLIYHGSSTCKMGRQNDKMAVLDSRARVRGVTGVRVVDASSFPNLPPGQPMATVYMFAEAIAESILSGN